MEQTAVGGWTHGKSVFVNVAKKDLQTLLFSRKLQLAEGEVSDKFKIHFSFGELHKVS